MVVAVSVLRLLLKIKHFLGGTGEVIEVKFKLKSREFFWKGREEGVVRRRYKNILAGEAATLCN